MGAAAPAIGRGGSCGRLLHRRVERLEIPEILDVQRARVALKLAGSRIPFHIRHGRLAATAVRVVKPALDRIGVEAVKLVQDFLGQLADRAVGIGFAADDRRVLVPCPARR